MFSIIATAALVSVDALFIGMSLRLRPGFRPHLFLLIILIFSVACTLSYFGARFLTEYIDFDTRWLVAGIFMLMALNYISSGEKCGCLGAGTCAVVALLMSIDGIAATTALTLAHQTFFAPVAVVIAHVLILAVGCLLAKFLKFPQSLQAVVSSTCLVIVSVLALIA